MMATVDDNFDDIDLNELFNDFNDKQVSSSFAATQTHSNYHLDCPINQDELIEFTETDCTAPRTRRPPPIKAKRKVNKKQTTMYDYASSVSYRHKQFYSSLDNTMTSKTIVKGEKRPLTESQQSSPIFKKSKTVAYVRPSSSSPPPDFIDKLLEYLDQRSHPPRIKTEAEDQSVLNNQLKTNSSMF